MPESMCWWSSDPANMNYLTGYDGWSFYVPQCVVVSLDADTPLWIGRRMDVAGARHTTFLPESHIIGYPENYSDPGAASHEFCGDMIADRGWGQKDRRRGDGCLLLHRPRLCRTAEKPARRSLCQCRSAGQLDPPGQIGCRDRPDA
jgi:Xaa-Pro aminopeptidase